MRSLRIPVALVSGLDGQWESWLKGVPRDVYHTRGYHEYARGSGEGEPFLVVAGDVERGIAWPYLLRSVKGIRGLEGEDATDVTSVYGYAGPIAWGCEGDDAFVTTAWSQILDVWRDQRVIAAFTRFHPLLGNAALGRQMRLPWDGYGRDEPVSTGSQTVSIDCMLSDDEARRAYARVLRQEIVSARRAGLASEHDTEWAHLDTFVELYGLTMSRSGAEDRYLLTSEDVRRLRSEVARYAHLIVTRLGTTVAAAGIFTEFEGIVQAHLVGTNPDLRALSPLKVHLDDARHWAHVRGNRVLHLGGGRGGEADSLLRFKGRFSPHRHTFHTGKWIVQSRKYDEVTRRRATVAGRDDHTGFFPAYRAPIGPD